MENGSKLPRPSRRNRGISSPSSGFYGRLMMTSGNGKDACAPTPILPTHRRRKTPTSTRRGNSSRTTPVGRCAGVDASVDDAELNAGVVSGGVESSAASIRLLLPGNPLSSWDSNRRDDDNEMDDDNHPSVTHSNSLLALLATRDSIQTRISSTTATVHSRLTPDNTLESIVSSSTSSSSKFYRRHRLEQPQKRRSRSSFCLGMLSVFYCASLLSLLLLLPSASAFPSCSPNPCNHGAECVDSEQQVSCLMCQFFFCSLNC